MSFLPSFLLYDLSTTLKATEAEALKCLIICYFNKICQDTHFNQTYLPIYLRISIINNSNINNNNYNNNIYNNNNNKHGRNNSRAKQLTGETTHLIRVKRPTHKTRAKRLGAKRPTGETTHGRNDPDSVQIAKKVTKINLRIISKPHAIFKAWSQHL